MRISASSSLNTLSSSRKSQQTRNSDVTVSISSLCTVLAQKKDWGMALNVHHADANLNTKGAPLHLTLRLLYSVPSLE